MRLYTPHQDAAARQDIRDGRGYGYNEGDPDLCAHVRARSRDVIEPADPCVTFEREGRDVRLTVMAKPALPTAA